MQPVHSDSVKLSREVLPPQRPQSGLGVMLVAAAAMFFAVASSAFILRARMAQNCCPLKEVQAPAAVDWTARVKPSATAECGTPQYRTQPDGAIQVVYEHCPPRSHQPVGLQHFVIVDPSSSIEGGLEVHAIEP